MTQNVRQVEFYDVADDIKRHLAKPAQRALIDRAQRDEINEFTQNATNMMKNPQSYICSTDKMNYILEKLGMTPDQIVYNLIDNFYKVMTDKNINDKVLYEKLSKMWKNIGGYITAELKAYIDSEKINAVNKQVASLLKYCNEVHSIAENTNINLYERIQHLRKLESHTKCYFKFSGEDVPYKSSNLCKSHTFNLTPSANYDDYIRKFRRPGHRQGNNNTFKIDCILGKKIESSYTKYLIKWKDWGYNSRELSWQSASHISIDKQDALIDEYETDHSFLSKIQTGHIDVGFDFAELRNSLEDHQTLLHIHFINQSITPPRSMPQNLKQLFTYLKTALEAIFEKSHQQVKSNRGGNQSISSNHDSISSNHVQLFYHAYINPRISDVLKDEAFDNSLIYIYHQLRNKKLEVVAPKYALSKGFSESYCRENPTSFAAKYLMDRFDELMINVNINEFLAERNKIAKHLSTWHYDLVLDDGETFNTAFCEKQVQAALPLELEKLLPQVSNRLSLRGAGSKKPVPKKTSKKSRAK